MKEYRVYANALINAENEEEANRIGIEIFGIGFFDYVKEESEEDEGE